MRVIPHDAKVPFLMRRLIHFFLTAMKKEDPGIDGGWAWLVLIVVYLGIIIISTSLYMTGVLYVALLDQFGEDEAKTSLVGALNSGLLCLLGNYMS